MTTMRENLNLPCFRKIMVILCLFIGLVFFTLLVLEKGPTTTYGYHPLQFGGIIVGPKVNNSKRANVVYNAVTGTHSGIPISMCEATPSWADQMINPQSVSDLKNWKFKDRIKCPEFAIKTQKSVKRSKITLNCDDNTPKINISSTTSSSDVMVVPFGDSCLRKVIESCCHDENSVPNVLHYVWYGAQEIGYFHFLSFMSGLRFMKPCLILIHGKHLPYGPYWDYFIQLSPNVIHVQRKRIEVVYGKRLSFPEHGADVMRIEAIQEYGGLYLDFDQILLRPITPLRQYEMTMGRVFKDTLGNQFILASKNATFLNLWHQSYKNYRTGHWTYNSLIIPYQLSEKHPELIHIDGYNFTRPNYLQTKMIFKENYDWSTNYAMHLFIRWYKDPINVDIIRTLNTTIGAISRNVFFGNKELCEK